MRTTANIISRLTLFGNNAPIGSPYRNLCIEAADRLNTLHCTLGEVIDDQQLVNHGCPDGYCPIEHARQVYCLGGSE